MRKLLFLLFPALLYAIPAKTQNMVPNGDFEINTACSTGLRNQSQVTGWYDYHNSSADYFNTCFPVTAPGGSIPTNQYGWQYPANGNAYFGIINGHSSGTLGGNYKEYLVRNIISLAIGTKYEVSISVSLSNKSGMSTRDLGVWFYDIGPDTTLPVSFGSTPLWHVTPQISYSSYGNITDTQNWVRLIGYMTADSAYDHIVVGGFGTNTTSYYTATNHGVSPYFTLAYYYIDSVVVKLASGISNLYMDSMICAGDTFQVPYTLNNSYATYLSSNTFSVQLSNSAGKFSSGTTIIGTKTGNSNGSITCVVPTSITPGNEYRLRIISSNAVDTSGNSVKAIKIGVVKPVKPIASNNSPICTGDTLRLKESKFTTCLK